MPTDIASLTPFSDEVEVFNYIPQLTDLVTHGGTPGYTYAQVCSHHLHKARREGYSLVNRDAYVIAGTVGEADMILMVKGEADPLLSPLSGARLCLVDLEVETLTGHKVQKVSATDNGLGTVETPPTVPVPDKPATVQTTESGTAKLSL